MLISTNFNFQGNQLQNASLHPVGTAPSSPTIGQIYTDTSGSTHAVKMWMNVSSTAQWVTISTSANSFTNPMTTIGDIIIGDTGGAAIRLAGNTANSTKILGSVGTGSAATQAQWLGVTGTGTTLVTSASPTLTGTPAIAAATATTPSAGDNSTNVATTAWVQSSTQILGTQKLPVVAATNTTVTISNPGTSSFDGVAVSAGQRILLYGQSTASQNGIWVFNGSSSALTRPVDYAAGSTTAAFYGAITEVLPGGTANGGSSFYISTTGAITIDTTSVAWAAISTGTASKATNLVGAAWSIPYQSATDTTSMLAQAGTANHVLISGANNSAPSWSLGTLSLPTGSSLTLSGANALTLTTSGSTNVTLPTSGTLVGSNDTGSVTNTMLANNKITIGSTQISLGATSTSLAGVANITHIAGTTSVAPINLVSGALLSTPVAGALEFVTDTLSFTITTGTARKTIAFTDSTLTGTWNGGLISGQYGGTGVANTGKTITLGGNLTTSGSYATTLTVTNTTNVTLPTSGTLVGSADTGTVTNTMLAGSIANTKLLNSAVTYGTTSVSLGSSSTSIAGLTNLGIVAGTTTVAPINFSTSGSVVLTAATVGALEWDQSNLYITNAGPTRRTLLYADFSNIGSNILAGVNGGTGVNNSGKTITLGGNISTANTFTTSGNFAVQLTATAASTVTLPASTSAVMNYYTSAPSTNQVPYAGGASGLLTYLALQSSAQPGFLTQTSSGAPSWTTSTGSGNVVLATSPSIASPTITGGATFSTGTSSVSSGATLNIPSGASLTVASGATFTSGNTPSNATDVVNKQYVDALFQGQAIKATATVATTAALSPANTYNNGTNGLGATLTATGNGVLTVDGHAVLLNEIVLVMNEAAGANNGLYVCTTQGTAGAPYILTRHTTMDVASEYVGAVIAVENVGTNNKNTLWLCSNTAAPTVGTTGITFQQLNGATDLVQGTGITISGNTISLASGVITAGGPTGNATTVPVITYDTYGRLTTVTTQTISGVSPVGATLSSANIWVGSSGNVAAAVAVTGDVLISNTGVTSYNNAVPVSKGGSSLTAFTQYAIPYASTTSQLAFISPSTAGAALVSAGASAAPVFGKVILTQPATGSTLTIVNGKTLTVNNTVALSAGADSKTLNIGANNLTFSTAGDTTVTIAQSGTVTVPVKYTTTITGAGPSFTITHSLGNKNVMVSVYDNNDNLVLCDVVTTSTTQCTLTFGYGVPGAATYRVIVIG